MEACLACLNLLHRQAAAAQPSRAHGRAGSKAAPAHGGEGKPAVVGGLSSSGLFSGKGKQKAALHGANGEGYCCLSR